ncbi:hypothetical protein BDP27DRAFT_1373337 [Rhodocollybia butyracea]|uniref:Uncharacterized protein n=1 Tax=Rhodocollybia butyracea TaxID=206335 RepID=A0A9P5TXB3_9AGAR|nr:hypothetical protein BDP27DRAFT_1373337 [Rhodocollybia butyracea]
MQTREAENVVCSGKRKLSLSNASAQLPQSLDTPLTAQSGTEQCVKRTRTRGPSAAIRNAFTTLSHPLSGAMGSLVTGRGFTLPTPGVLTLLSDTHMGVFQGHNVSSSCTYPLVAAISEAVPPESSGSSLNKGTENSESCRTENPLPSFTELSNNEHPRKNGSKANAHYLRTEIERLIHHEVKTGSMQTHFWNLLNAPVPDLFEILRGIYIYVGNTSPDSLEGVVLQEPEIIITLFLDM